MQSTIKQNGVFHGLMYILLLSMSAHLTKQLGMAPGGEFRRAFAEVSCHTWYCETCYYVIFFMSVLLISLGSTCSQFLILKDHQAMFFTYILYKWLIDFRLDRCLCALYIWVIDLYTSHYRGLWLHCLGGKQYVLCGTS